MKTLMYLSFIAVLFLSCGNESKNDCFEQGNMASCADLCDTASNEEACVKHIEIGLQKCTQDNDLKTCANMCLMAKTGNKVFCDHKEKLCQKTKNQSLEACM